MAEHPEDRPRRADAERNRAAIIEAAVTCLSADPRASMADIAQAAGVGRLTLYGHFSSRRELIDAIVEQTMREAEAQLAPLSMEGDPTQALELLVTTSWQVLVRSHGVLTAAEQELGQDGIRHHHDQTMRRVGRLIQRGQAEGAFRSDLSAAWFTACFFALLHGASAEIRAGRMDEREAASAVSTTIAALVAVPETASRPA